MICPETALKSEAEKIFDQRALNKEPVVSLQRALLVFI